MLTLSDILSRAVQIHWYEAVALMREVAERLPSSGGAGMSVPDLHQVALHQSGQVDVRGGIASPEPIQRLGELFQSMLGRSDDLPVQLRLVAAQTTAPGQPYASVADFSEALGFFERPGRSQILQELYARASAAPPAQPVASAFDASAVARSEDDSQGSRRKTPSRQMVLAGIGAALVIAAIVGVFATRGAGGDSAVTQISDLTARATKSVGAAVASAVSAIDRRGTTTSAPPAPAAEAPVEEKRVSKPTGKRQQPTTSAPAAALLQRATLNAFDLPSPSATTGTNGSNGTHGPSKESATSPSSAPADDTVYSAESAGITPPVAMRPQLPRELPQGVRLDDLNRVELVILPNGTVDSVKLIGRNANVHDSMLLSAIKAWEFRPAKKSGVPVKFRKTVWLVR